MEDAGGPVDGLADRRVWWLDAVESSEYMEQSTFVHPQVGHGYPKLTVGQGYPKLTAVYSVKSSKALRDPNPRQRA